MTRKISSKINTQGLSVIHLNAYKLTEVIAELVDNSIDSFIKNDMSGKLIVDIDFRSDEIIYRDNAFGFDSTAFESSFQTHISNTENVTYGTYGVGMKHALLWLGSYTILESISQKDKSGYRTVYPNIVDGKVQDHLTLEENLVFDLGIFNTRFTICESRHYRYNTNDLVDLKSSLEEIYKFYSDKLQISINGVLLNLTTKFELLVARYVGDYKKINNVLCLEKSNSESLTWKFELPSPLTLNVGEKLYGITGFIGLQKGTGSSESGIRVYRNNRCVLGFSANDRFRPFGSNNSHESKTFVGEFHISGFEKVTIGHGLPELRMLKDLFTHLAATMKQGGYDDPVADKMFTQAANYRINTYPLAPLCATLGSPGIPGNPPGSPGGSSGGGTQPVPPRPSQNLTKLYKVRVADQLYNIKTELSSGPASIVTSKSQSGDIDIEIKMNLSLQEMSVKLFAELYDVHLKFQPITGLNPDDEIKDLLNRLGT